MPRTRRPDLAWLGIGNAASVVAAVTAATVGLGSLTAQLLGVVDQTMQPTTAALWLRPQPSSGTAAGPARPAGPG
jgi:hypothetical protein